MAAATAASVPMNRIERAHQMYREGRYEEALEFYTEALGMAKTKHQKIALHSNRAACFLKLHDFKKAAEECTSVLELDYNHTGALMLRAQTLVTLKEYHSALFDVNRLVELNPSSEVYRSLHARLKTQLSLAPIPEAETELEEDEESEYEAVQDEESEDEAEEAATKHLLLFLLSPIPFEVSFLPSHEQPDLITPAHTSMVEPAHKLTLNPNTATSPPTTIKFLCSYGGRILPRLSDGKLRYHGGETRVLSVDRSISFAELLVKLGELCGSSVMLRCQLPTEDLDALVSITSDEDLANLIEEYDRAAVSIKIRAFLSPPKSAKKISPPPSIAPASASLDAAGSPISLYSVRSSSRFPDRVIHQTKPVAYQKPTVVKAPHHHHAYYLHHGNLSHLYLIHKGNHWQ